MFASPTLAQARAPRARTRLRQQYEAAVAALCRFEKGASSATVVHSPSTLPQQLWRHRRSLGKSHLALVRAASAAAASSNVFAQAPRPQMYLSGQGPAKADRKP